MLSELLLTSERRPGRILSVCKQPLLIQMPSMKQMISNFRTLALLVSVVFLTLLPLSLSAETCSNAVEMDAATRSAIESAASGFFADVSRNDAASLQRNAIASLASNFSAVQAAVADNQPVLGNAQGTVRATYLLDTGGSGTLQNAEFLCGIWGTPQFVSFAIPNLPAGRYGLVIMDVKGAKGPYYASFVLQQDTPNGPWKLAGMPSPSPAEVLGHDAPWFLEQARNFKSKGQIHNAWFYYQQAKTLADPVAFMVTTPVVKLQREMQQSQPADIPTNGQPVTLAAANGKSYSLTQVFPVLVENGMDLVVKYSEPDISDTGKTFQDNMAVISALIGKIPEFRQTFQGVVARATTPNGQDYGTLLAMKDIK
jgi:hypothetical protein